MDDKPGIWERLLAIFTAVLMMLFVVLLVVWMIVTYPIDH